MLIIWYKWNRMKSGSGGYHDHCDVRDPSCRWRGRDLCLVPRTCSRWRRSARSWRSRWSGWCRPPPRAAAALPEGSNGAAPIGSWHQTTTGSPGRTSARSPASSNPSVNLNSAFSKIFHGCFKDFSWIFQEFSWIFTDSEGFLRGILTVWTYLEWNSAASLRKVRPGWVSTTSWTSPTKSSGTKWARPPLTPLTSLTPLTNCSLLTPSLVELTPPDGFCDVSKCTKRDASSWYSLTNLQNKKSSFLNHSNRIQLYIYIRIYFLQKRANVSKVTWPSFSPPLAENSSDFQ